MHDEVEMSGRLELMGVETECRHSGRRIKTDIYLTVASCQRPAMEACTRGQAHHTTRSLRVCRMHACRRRYGVAAHVHSGLLASLGSSLA